MLMLVMKFHESTDHFIFLEGERKGLAEVACASTALLTFGGRMILVRV